ncbi:MAG TPA: helix-turn-helix domain-containing protein [Dyella sp.]|uniref:winged helix-turn-helix transcriptional regulator n=1 Tax=Dyella sp. TaxID=1869338 RepID=UPI002C5B153A|nr:helix-turn-helix domain-containing protein [Dyella sp.]HTV83982.1 helix-turn-helix domain-containing protein [Dyella sp.]HUB46890.1 helix-turn-helix domain-containing protein [Acetobacteraceae bacterium]
MKPGTGLPRKKSAEASQLVVDENCPPRRIHDVIGPKWTSMVMYVLSFGSLRTGALQRALPGASKKMLFQTLRELEMDGLINRTVFQVVPPMVEYSLSELGQRFVEPLMALYEWAEKNSALLDELEQRQTARTAQER